MNGNFPPVERIVEKNDRFLRRIFGKMIKGAFLIKMKYHTLKKHPEIFNYYNLTPGFENFVVGNQDTIEYDVCRMIVGCHSFHTVFLSDEERRSLEQSSKYRDCLAQEVYQHVRLRKYGSRYFKPCPLVGVELFIAYNLPYDMFVMTIRANEILASQKCKSPYNHWYSVVINKALATLCLMEDNLLDSCYPSCRAAIEVYIKLLVLKNYPDLVETHNKFARFEISQSCCEQVYPDEFNELFDSRIVQKTTKNSYLHYGWVDYIDGYHDVVKQNPYGIIGILNFLESYSEEDEHLYFSSLQRFYKMCHGYTHGNVSMSKYPLLHYFEISQILFYTVVGVYEMLCEEYQMDNKIEGIDIVDKAVKDFEILAEQYGKRSTENFENHYSRFR